MNDIRTEHVTCITSDEWQNDGSFLIMKRDYNKKTAAGMFEASAGGNALK